MRTLQQVLPRYALALVACAATAACGSETTSEPPPPPPPLSVQPSHVTVAVGSIVKLFAALPQGSQATTLQSEVVWRSTSDSIATINSGGTVRGMKSGQTRVVALWHGSQGLAFVTVLNPQGGGKRPPCASVAASVPKAGQDPC